MRVAKYRESLPQLTTDRAFLTEGGIETTLVYEKQIDLPYFAAISLLNNYQGRETLSSCYQQYLDIALSKRAGIVLETRTWRGAKPWGEKLGISAEQFVQLNRNAVSILLEIRAKYETTTTPIVISGNLGPLSDAYKDSQGITAESAREAYYEQVKALVECGVDMLSIMTMTNTEEVKAAVLLARDFKVPIHVSFSIEEDGRLLNERELGDIIQEVDMMTDGYVAYFGINCAHPIHALPAIQRLPDHVRTRIGSFRGNASIKCHDELDNSSVLDRGDVSLFSAKFQELYQRLPRLRVFGGCCGTDAEHIEKTAERIFADLGS